MHPTKIRQQHVGYGHNQIHINYQDVIKWKSKITCSFLTTCWLSFCDGLWQFLNKVQQTADSVQFVRHGKAL